MTHTPSQRPARRGVTIVETAVVLLVTLTFLLAIFEYGRFLMVRQLAQNAVRDGARMAVAGSTTQTSTTIQTQVLADLAGQPLLNSSGQALQLSDIQVYRNPTTGGQNATDSTWSDAIYGDAVAVKISGQYKPILPTFGFLPTTVPVTVEAMMLSEAN